MVGMEFGQAWARVAKLAGEEFRLESGEPFRYAFKHTFIVISPNGLSLPKTNFRKVFLHGGAAAVQGRRHIRAILRDPRIAAPAGETDA